MSQSWFSLGFLSQNSLWKLSTLCGYKGIYSSVCEECEKSIFCKIGHSDNLALRLVPATSFSREKTNLLDCHFFPVVLQLSWPFNFLHASHVWNFGELPVASHSRDLVTRNLQMHTFLNFFTLSYTQLLHNSHLNIGYLITKLQANLARNKANTWLNKFNLRISPFDYSMTKP